MMDISSHWNKAKEIATYSLSDSDKESLALKHREEQFRRDALWVRAWNHVTHADRGHVYSDAYTDLWIPYLEGKAYGPAVWGAVLAEVFSDEITSDEAEALRRPWSSLTSVMN